MEQITPTHDASPVRVSSTSRINERVDRDTLARLRDYAARDGNDIGRRIGTLTREWDIDRVLGLNAAALGLAGAALATRNRRWLALPAVMLGLFALHALQGWCPPVGALRRMGVRTRGEIERERYALKALRGDFEGARGRSQAAWRAVRE